MTLLLALFFGYQTPGFALAVSDIQLNSHLNQRLDATIQLLSATPEELDSLTIDIKPKDDAAGTIYRWPKLSMEVSSDASGRHFIQIKSAEPVTEPMLNFILELSWARGRLEREYVLLIDPVSV